VVLLSKRNFSLLYIPNTISEAADFKEGAAYSTVYTYTLEASCNGHRNPGEGRRSCIRTGHRAVYSRHLLRPGSGGRIQFYHRRFASVVLRAHNCCNNIQTWTICDGINPCWNAGHRVRHCILRTISSPPNLTM